ncbi:MAG: alpha-amylase family glycosyl hydrolase [Dermabacter sp.]|nr:alpha-amylase family glycosyl hydrolase [Dermabacter sp.]
MSWSQHAIWWHVYPLGFTDAPIREGDTRTGRGFAHLTGWLDYVVELGLNGIILGPIFASSSHGYDTLDYFAIDPRLGTEADFDEFLAACRARGIRVLLDGVFSHVSIDYPPLKAALEAGPDSPGAAEFDIDVDAPGGPAPRVWEGHGSLARFNHGSEAARSTVRDVMRHWLARGIDGWRLDAAYSVPSDFWRAVLPPVREEFPEAYFVGEVIHGDYIAFVDDSGVDSLTQYELWKAIFSSIESANFFELEWTLGRHNTLLEHFVPLTFVGNHDTSRLASVIGADGALAAHALLLTLGGAPSLYYGDEQLFRGVKEERIGGDDDVRQAFPATPSDLLASGEAMREQIAALVGLRRRHPWLVRAATEVLEVQNESLVYRVRERDGDGFLTVHARVADGGAHVRIDAADGSELWSQRPV